ncbi:MAG: hypothetical protein HWN80_18525 [Candidatus Lokiarchaeota archaeon]|nr:hypothetical protein [Candidatus Lokiarchaeota archaeon]
MEIWKINLKFSDGTINELEMYDAKAYFNGYLTLKRTYFIRLVKAIKMTKKYTTGHAIERVIGPDAKEWTGNSWMLLLIKDNEKKNPFWVLIKRERDLSGLLIAIGPKSFAEYNNSNMLEAKRDIKRLINYIVAYLNKFNCSVLLPNYLS